MEEQPFVGTLESDRYLFDKFNDGTFALPVDIHEDNLSRFVDKYASELRDVRSAQGAEFSLNWEAGYALFTLETAPYQQRSVVELVDDSRMTHSFFLKALKVLSALVIEIDDLELLARNQYFPGLALFAEKPQKDGSSEDPICEGSSQIQIGKIFPFLQSLHRFVHRCYAVFVNTMQQLGSLFSMRSAVFSTSLQEGCKLMTVFGRLGDLLAWLSFLDEIIMQSEALREAWTAYERMLAIVRTDPVRYGVSEDNVFRFGRMFETLDGELMTGQIYRECIQQPMDTADVTVSRNSHLHAQLLAVITQLTDEASAKLASAALAYDARRLPACLCLWGLFLRFSGPQVLDKKQLKLLWQTVAQAPVAPIIGSYSWNGLTFIRDLVPKTKYSESLDPSKALKEAVGSARKDFARLGHTMCLQACVLLVRLQSERVGSTKVPGEVTAEVLLRRADLLTTGIALAEQTSNLMLQFIHLHLNAGQAMGNKDVATIGECCETLKAIQMGIASLGAQLSEAALVASSTTQVKVAKMFASAESKLGTKGAGRLSGAQLDLFSLSLLGGDLIKTPTSRSVRILLDLIADFSAPKLACRFFDLERLREHLSRLKLLAEFKSTARRLCDCSVLYWIRQVLPSLFSRTFKDPESAIKLVYLFAAIYDVEPLLKSVTPPADATALISNFQSEIQSLVDSKVVEPACREIENDLRLHTQSASLEAMPENHKRNPFTKPQPNLAALCRTPPLRLFGQLVDINKRISQYMNRTFYNLTSIALHDWKIYVEMRGLAKAKYGLDLIESRLPTQTLDQGLDVLEIMRNIHVFVSAFQYNLNNQFFVEANSDSNQLNTISIRHVSNSIRQHGLGVMNTAVNFTYQFLTRKFEIFSQFLFDPVIESRLMREIRSFKDYLETESAKTPGASASSITGGLKTIRKTAKLPYPYSRGHDFCIDLRKVGVSGSVLDSFMKLITEIGNALGYVRMVRSGGLHYCAEAVEFLPDLNKPPMFEQSARETGLSNDCIVAAQNLDNVVRNLTHNFSEGTDYFKYLVRVFVGVMQNERNVHLRAFHIIVPALTINYVEAMITRAKKIKSRAGSFSDDGFAIGLAYILELLNQSTSFDSLQWFESVNKHFHTSSDDINKKLKDPLIDKETLKMAARKNHQYQEEFEQFYYSFNAARIFFRQ